MGFWQRDSFFWTKPISTEFFHSTFLILCLKNCSVSEKQRLNIIKRKIDSQWFHTHSIVHDNFFAKKTSLDKRRTRSSQTRRDVQVNLLKRIICWLSIRAKAEELHFTVVEKTFVFLNLERDCFADKLPYSCYFLSKKIFGRKISISVVGFLSFSWSCPWLTDFESAQSWKACILDT